MKHPGPAGASVQPEAKQISTSPTSHKPLPLSRASQRLAEPGSDVWRVHYDALARAAKGEDVILLSVGDPDFDTPDAIAAEVVRSIRSGRTHYSPAAGEDGLRETIATMEQKNTGNAIAIEQVAIFPGATAALYAAFASICDEGDTILVPEPMYVGYHSIVSALGLNLVTVPLAAPEFQLDVAQLLATLDAQTSVKAVLLNTPGNPLGNMLSADTLDQVATACRARNIWLICDEVYSLVTFEQRHVSLLNTTNNYQNLLVVDGLSKSHAMSGWRLGWAVGDETLVQAMVRFSAAALFGVSQFIQDGAAFALQHDAPDVERMRTAYQARRDFLVRGLADLGLSCFAPPAGMFVMLDAQSIESKNFTRYQEQQGTAASSAITLGEHCANWLLTTAGISTIPGSAFGPSAENYVRVSLTLDRSGLSAALERIKAQL